MIWHSKLHWFPVHSMGQDFWVSVQKAAHSFTCRLYKSKDHHQHKTFIQLNNVLPGISFIHFTSTQSLKSTSMFKPDCKKKTLKINKETSHRLFLKMDHRPKIRVWPKLVPIPLYALSISSVWGWRWCWGRCLSLSPCLVPADCWEMSAPVWIFRFWKGRDPSWGSVLQAFGGASYQRAPCRAELFASPWNEPRSLKRAKQDMIHHHQTTRWHNRDCNYEWCFSDNSIVSL